MKQSIEILLAAAQNMDNEGVQMLLTPTLNMLLGSNVELEAANRLAGLMFKHLPNNKLGHYMQYFDKFDADLQAVLFERISLTNLLKLREVTLTERLVNVLKNRNDAENIKNAGVWMSKFLYSDNAIKVNLFNSTILNQNEYLVYPSNPDHLRFFKLEHLSRLDENGRKLSGIRVPVRHVEHSVAMLNEQLNNLLFEEQSVLTNLKTDEMILINPCLVFGQNFQITRKGNFHYGKVTKAPDVYSKAFVLDICDRADVLYTVKDETVFIGVDEIAFSELVKTFVNILYKDVKRLSHEEFFADNANNVQVKYDEAKKKIYVKTYMHEMHTYNYFDTITQAENLIYKLANLSDTE